MKPEEKQALLAKGEEVFQTGSVFTDKLDEWTKMVMGVKDIIEETKDDPDFQEINDKLGQLNNRLEKFM